MHYHKTSSFCLLLIGLVFSIPLLLTSCGKEKVLPYVADPVEPEEYIPHIDRSMWVGTWDFDHFYRAHHSDGNVIEFTSSYTGTISEDPDVPNQVIIQVSPSHTANSYAVDSTGDFINFSCFCGFRSPTQVFWSRSYESIGLGITSAYRSYSGTKR